MTQLDTTLILAALEGNIRAAEATAKEYHKTYKGFFAERHQLVDNAVDAAKEALANFQSFLDALSAGYALVPQRPTEACLGSMAMRDNHGYGLSMPVIDMKTGKPMFNAAGKFVMENETEMAERQARHRGRMSQLYEEVVGKGFHHVDALIKPVINK